MFKHIEDYNEGKLELLTIIARTLQILSSFILIVTVLSFVTMKLKSKKNKMKDSMFVKLNDGGKSMSHVKNLTQSSDPTSQLILRHKTQSNVKDQLVRKTKIYAVYNPNSRPNFYLHSKLNWYKNFD